MKAYIKELTAEEVIITDNENIVAGMTSGNSDKVSSQGNVRIWAGTNDKNASNIAEAPFTVTDKGVLTCRGNDGNIILKDGTIYFIVGGTEYKLGITMVSQIGLIAQEPIVQKSGMKRENLIQM